MVTWDWMVQNEYKSHLVVPSWCIRSVVPFAATLTLTLTSGFGVPLALTAPGILRRGGEVEHLHNVFKEVVCNM
jgi:hypothetical protein